MGDDASGASDPPLSIGQTDGTGQAGIAARGIVTGTRAGSVVGGGEGGVVHLHFGAIGERDNGARAREHADRLALVAGTTIGAGVEVWTSAARMIRSS